MGASRIHNNRQIVLGMPMITVPVVQLVRFTMAKGGCHAGDRELVTYLNTEISNQLRGFVENTGGIVWLGALLI